MKLTAHPPRLPTLFVGLGATALLLAAVGPAGVLWFTTRQRTREIRIRMALGVSPGRIRLEVLREGAGLTLAGLVVGGRLRRSRWPGCSGACSTRWPPRPPDLRRGHTDPGHGGLRLLFRPGVAGQPR